MACFCMRLASRGFAFNRPPWLHCGPRGTLFRLPLSPRSFLPLVPPIYLMMREGGKGGKARGVGWGRAPKSPRVGQRKLPATVGLWSDAAWPGSNIGVPHFFSREELFSLSLSLSLSFTFSSSSSSSSLSAIVVFIGASVLLLDAHLHPLSSRN